MELTEAAGCNLGDKNHSQAHRPYLFFTGPKRSLSWRQKEQIQGTFSRILFSLSQLVVLRLESVAESQVTGGPSCHSCWFSGSRAGLGICIPKFLGDDVAPPKASTERRVLKPRY